MCGIVGYVGERQAQNILLDSLKRLEYRGYDSAGIAVLDSKKKEDRITIQKQKGMIKELEKELVPSQGTLGITHTRWATHGPPSQVNAHPHTDPANRVAIVHNGIIENFLELRDRLLNQGHRFRSETDTELVAHLIADYYNGVQQNIHPVELASKFHQKFEEIHPFQDGNGRTGRAILNYMLGRYDFPQIYLTRMHQSEYLTALQKGNEEIFDPLLHFIMARINGTMLYLYSKTNLYEFFTSKEYGNLYRDLGAKDVFDRWMATVKEHHENDEVP